MLQKEKKLCPSCNTPLESGVTTYKEKDGSEKCLICKAILS